MLLTWLADGEEPQPVAGIAGGEVLPPGQPGIQRAGKRITGPVVPGRVVSGGVGLGALAGADQVQQVGLVRLARGAPRRDPGGAGRTGGAAQPSRGFPGNASRKMTKPTAATVPSVRNAAL